VVIPDRTGYGRSGRIDEDFPLDFHRQAAAETLDVMNALGLENPVLWGHSDGACAAVWVGLMAPARCRALVLEALHFDRAKPRSREFFARMERAPQELGARVGAVLAAEHGEDYWESLMRRGGRVWRALREAPLPHPDLFAGRLPELTVPVLVLHGTEDPRTEPGELQAIQAALPHANVALIAGGGHCPHSENGVWRQATTAVVDFLQRLPPLD
jgi:pimeloyl-ACP methyl ester carboxylesterase